MQMNLLSKQTRQGKRTRHQARRHSHQFRKNRLKMTLYPTNYCYPTWFTALAERKIQVLFTWRRGTAQKGSQKCSESRLEQMTMLDHSTTSRSNARPQVMVESKKFEELWYMKDQVPFKRTFQWITPRLYRPIFIFCEWLNVISMWRYAFPERGQSNICSNMIEKGTIV